MQANQILYLRHEKRSRVQVPFSKYAMSHGHLAKQSCLAWLITPETWASVARGWAHRRHVEAQGLIQSDGHLHLDYLTDHQTIHTSLAVYECVCAHVNADVWLKGRLFFFCLSGLVHLSPSAAGSCSYTHSHGCMCCRLTAQCKKKKHLAVQWVTKSTCQLSSSLYCKNSSHHGVWVVFKIWEGVILRIMRCLNGKIYIYI